MDGTETSFGLHIPAQLNLFTMCTYYFFPKAGRGKHNVLVFLFFFFEEGKVAFS